MNNAAAERESNFLSICNFAELRDESVEDRLKCTAADMNHAIHRQLAHPADMI